MATLDAIKSRLREAIENNRRANEALRGQIEAGSDVLCQLLAGLEEMSQPVLSGARLGHDGAPSNVSPSWSLPVSITFFRGSPQTYDFAEISLGWLVDPDGPSLSMQLYQGSLPAGVEITGSTSLSFDGTGTGDVTSAVVFLASDGIDSVASSSVDIIIIDQEPSFTGGSAIEFVEGVASSYDLTQHTVNFDPELHAMELSSGSLPDGVALDPAGSLDYDGEGASAGPNAFDITIVDTISTLLLWTDVGNDGPSTSYANNTLYLRWPQTGGYWSDADGVNKGTNHWASAVITGFTPPELDLVFDVSALVVELLNFNTGFCLTHGGTGPSPNFYPREDTANPTKWPKLNVVTDQGSFDPPLVADSHLLDGNCRGTDNPIKLPMCLRFNLTGITGAVQSATLTIRYKSGFVGNTFPAPVYCDRLDLPALYTEPATQIGGVQHGLANTVAQDSGLAALGQAQGLFYYAEFEDETTTFAQWNAIGMMGSPPTGLLSAGGSTPEYKDWPEYGMKAVRVEGNTAGPRASNFHALVPGANPSYWWKSDWGNSTHSDLYFRYMLYIDPDVATYMNELGVKLPGFSGTYEFTAQDSPQVSFDDNWSGRMEHGRYSPLNDCFRFYWYWYGADHSIVDFPSLGDFRFDDGIIVPISLVPGRKYCLEQRIKLNTFSGGVAQSDGILESWVDGVKWYSKSNVLIRQDDERIRYESVPFFNIYHGGNTPPLGPIHYEISGVCVATQYIGPPKVIA